MSIAKRLVWLASARARLCFEAKTVQGRLGVELVGLVADRECGALRRAEEEGLEARLVAPLPDEPREMYCERLAGALREFSPELLFSQFHLLLSPGFVNEYRRRILNVHNGLLPAFRGFGGHRRAVEEGVRFAGATLHYIDEGTDTGPIVAQAVTPVSPGDTPTDIDEKLWPHLRRMALSGLSWHAEGRIVVDGGRTRVEGADYTGYPVCPAPEVP